MTMSETPRSLLVAANWLSSSCNSRTSCATLHEGGEADGVLSKPRVGGSNPSRRAKLPNLDCFLPGGGGPSCGPDSGFSLRLRGASENLASATIEFGTKCSVPGPARAPATGTQGADVTLELIRCRHSQEGHFPVLSTQKELVQ